MACLYAIGLAVALLIRAGEPWPTSAQGWMALLAVPLLAGRLIGNGEGGGEKIIDCGTHDGALAALAFLAFLLLS